MVEYANQLAARGHKVRIVTSPGWPHVESEIDSKVRVLRTSRQVSRAGAYRNMGLAIDMLRRIPVSDVIIATHSPTTPIAAAAAKIMRRGRAVWLYMDYPEMFAGRPLQALVHRLAPAWFDLILCLSKSSAEEIRGRRHPRCAGKVEVVGLGLIGAGVFSPSPQERRDPSQILFVGDSRPRKGLSDLLAAMTIVCRYSPEVHLLIVSREDLGHLIDRGFPFPITVVAAPDMSSLAQHYRRCGVFVSASWAEGFGLPPLEAMACGAPAVVSDSRGVREYARHEENCLMVPPRDPGAMAEAILRMIRDRSLAEALASEGIRTANCFDWSAAVSRFERALFRVVNEG